MAILTHANLGLRFEYISRDELYLAQQKYVGNREAKLGCSGKVELTCAAVEVVKRCEGGVRGMGL